MKTLSKEDLKFNKKLGFIGCGKMASAIASGIYKSCSFEPKNIYLFDINENQKEKLANEFNFNTTKSIEELVNTVDVIFLAVKPFVVDDVLAEIQKNYKNQLILSILAGVKIEKYKKYLKNSKVIRIMPNTPALVKSGMSAICPDEVVDSNDIDIAKKIMSGCGKILLTSEEKIDVITALSGSGPAFYYKIIELMAKSAQKLGLNKDEALLLSTQTALGSAKMIFENNFDISTLITNVTTPGGCTAVGNEVLINSDIDKIFDKLIKDTMQKAIELG